jgi:predicted DNA-binding transcriptional regulator YafY
VTAPALAARFEVSVRTIERDVQALLEAGVPIWTERGRRGGYAIDPALSLPPLNLTAAEAVAVAVALAALGDNPFTDAGRSAQQKLVSAMSPTRASEARSLASRVRVAPARGFAEPETVRTVRRAVERSEVVNLDYVDADGARTRRDVEAHGLYVTGGTWALVGWCRLRDAGRVFRLDRIERVVPTGERNPDRDFDEVLGWMPPEFRPPPVAEA